MGNERVVSRVEDSWLFASKIEIYFQRRPIFVARSLFFYLVAWLNCKVLGKKKEKKISVLWSRKYFFWLHGAVIPNCSSGPG
jgi:hypothetical protein